MSRALVNGNRRMSLCLRPDEESTLERAAALRQTSATEFVLKHALAAAAQVIEDAEHVQLSGRDSLRVLELLENPPAPNARLRAAADALPRRQ